MNRITLPATRFTTRSTLLVVLNGAGWTGARTNAFLDTLPHGGAMETSIVQDHLDAFTAQATA